MSLRIGLNVTNPSAFHMFLTKLPRLTEDPGASAGTSQLTLGIYMATFAFVRLGYGPVSNRVGRH